MSTTRAEIDAFHQFAIRHLATQDSSLSLDELLITWYDDQDQNDVDQIVSQGLRDADAGLGKPARELTAEIRKKYGL